MGTTERVMRGWLGEHKSYRVLETIPCELSNRMETTNPERVMGNHRASQCGDRQGLHPKVDVQATDHGQDTIETYLE